MSDSVTTTSPTPTSTPFNLEGRWEEQVNRWSKSGLSKSAYCKSAGIDYHQMIYWSRKLAINNTGEEAQQDKPSTKIKSNGFVAVSVTPSATALFIRLPNGIEIGGIVEQQLAHVIDLSQSIMIQHDLRPSTAIPVIYLHGDPVDFRKSYRGLSQIVEHELGHNPFSGMLYVFCNRHKDRIKCLFWERTGFVLYYKALIEERFHWPSSDESLVTLTGEQFNWLLDGYNLAVMQPHRELQYESVG